MKTPTRTFLVLAAMVFVVLAQSKAASVRADGDSTKAKWYPGHYLTLGLNQPREGWKAIAGNQKFAGGQRIYTWRELEPAAGKYDFTALEADLACLRQQNQRLILEVWDNSFDGHTLPVPNYLMNPAYKGGIARPAKSSSVIRTKRWVPAVMDRYLLLMEELGKRFDRDPHFAGLVHTETAMENKGAGFEDFSGADFHTQMLRLVVASRKAFPHTPVIVYGNWYPYRGSEGLTDLSKCAQEVGVGWGGPDLLPGKNIWGYDIIRANAGQMPLGLSAQWDTYKGEFTATKLLDFAIKDMKLNFVFWGNFNRSKSGGLSFVKDVIPAVEAYGQSLVTQRPDNLSQPKK